MIKKKFFKVQHGKKMIGAGLFGLMLMGCMTAFAGNIQYAYYGVNIGADGYVLATEEKQDYTSSYIFHQGDRAVYVGVYSEGINYSANGSYYYVGVGMAAYLPNYVKENGRNDCYLWLIPSTAGACRLYGQWSPDSV